MVENISKTWSNNHGWQLSGASLIVGMVACLIWYMDWVPQILLSGPTAKQPLISQTIQPQSGILVAQITGLPGSEKKKGRILMYLQSETPDQPPLYQEKFTFDERNMAAILLIVPSGDYTVIAFMDDNDNGQLDFEGDKALESICLPASASIPNADAPASVEGGVVKLLPQVPTLCTFEFVKQ